MLKTYDLLNPRQEPGGHWNVALAAPIAEVTVAPDARGCRLPTFLLGRSSRLVALCICFAAPKRRAQ